MASVNCDFVTFSAGQNGLMRSVQLFLLTSYASLLLGFSDFFFFQRERYIFFVPHIGGLSLKPLILSPAHGDIGIWFNISILLAIINYIFSSVRVIFFNVQPNSLMAINRLIPLPNSSSPCRLKFLDQPFYLNLYKTLLASSTAQTKVVEVNLHFWGNQLLRTDFMSYSVHDYPKPQQIYRFKCSLIVRGKLR